MIALNLNMNQIVESKELTEPGTFDIACHSMPEMQIIVNVAK